MIDVEKALLDPAAIFKHPQQVIDTNDLSRDQKIEVLRRWEYDVREIQVLEMKVRQRKKRTPSRWIQY